MLKRDFTESRFMLAVAGPCVPVAARRDRDHDRDVPHPSPGPGSLGVTVTLRDCDTGSLISE